MRTTSPVHPIRAAWPTLRHAWVPFGKGGGGLSSFGLYDAVRGATGLLNTAGTGPGVLACASAVGPAIKFDNTGSGSVDSVRIKVGDSGGSGSPGGNVFSVLILANIGSTASQSLYGANTNGIEFRINSSNKQELLKSGVASIGSSTTSVSFGVWQAYGMTYDGTTVRFYLNGLADGSASSTQTFTHTQQYEIGGRGAASSDVMTNASMVAFVGVFDSVLTPVSMLSLSKNPWQVFQQKKRRSVNAVSGGGSTIFGSYYYRQVAGMAGTP